MLSREPEAGKQSAAIPYRFERDRLEILLVTSRTRKRWILPKGKIKPGMMANRSAEREAFEEAGVLGRIASEPVGSYRQRDGIAVWGDTVVVQAYALKVANEIPKWREMHLRKRRWFTMKDAIKSVRDPEIRAVLQSFEQSMMTKALPDQGNST